MSEEFTEDRHQKLEWFLQSRGGSLDELDRQRDLAVAQADGMRRRDLVITDPGGGAPEERAVLRAVPGGRLRARARAVLADKGATPPQADGLVSPVVTVTGLRDGDAAYLVVTPLRGARRATDLTTTRFFLRDDTTGRWSLVEDSGANVADGYLHARVHRDGTYVAAALPRSQAGLETLTAQRYVQVATRFGLDHGLLASRADLFSTGRLTAIKSELKAAGNLTTARNRDLTALHRLATKVAKTGPGGLDLRWTILDDIFTTTATQLPAWWLDRYRDLWPWLLHVSDRVGRWTAVGPTHTGGRVKSIAVHPSNGSILYAGAANGGVWKTTSGGDYWTPLWTFQATMAVGAIAVAPTRANTVYAATGEDTPNYGPSYGGTGIFRSTDAGLTWTNTAPASVVGGRCNRLVVDPTNADRLFVSSDAGVLRSTDGGVTWTNLRMGHATDLVMAHDDPNRLYAGFWNDGVYVTHNGGSTWSRIHGTFTIDFFFGTITFTFPTGGAAGWIKLAIGRSGPHGSNRLLVKMGDQSADLYGSNDGGLSWMLLPGHESVDYDEWTSFVTLHPSLPDVVFIGGLGLQRSLNGGGTFVGSPGTHSDHHQMAFHPTSPNRCWVVCDGGIYRSDDCGASWTHTSNLLQVTQFVSLGVSKGGTQIVGGATQDQGIIQSENGNRNFVDHGGGNEWGMFVVDPNDSATIFASPGGGQLRRSTNHGQSWNNPTSGLTRTWNPNGGASRTTPAASFGHVAVRPGDSSKVIGVGTISDEVKDANGNVVATFGPTSRIFHSTDGGASWASAFWLNEPCTRLAFAPSDGNRVYAGSHTGRFLRSDAGGSWGWYEPGAATLAPKRLPGGWVTDIAVQHNRPNTVYVTFGNVNPHVYRSTDGGVTWSSVSGSVAGRELPDIPVSAILIDPENSDCLWVGTDIGVFRSNDAGQTWYAANDGPDGDDLPRVVVTGLRMHEPSHRVYAATLGRGMYATQATGLTRLRATHVRTGWSQGKPYGIKRLRLTDGQTTYDMARAEVVARIEAGTEVFVRDSAGHEARVLTPPMDISHPIPWLRTETDWLESDNLLSLPQF